MRIVWRMVVINVMMTLEYRGAFFVLMLNNILLPLISLLVWLTVGEQGVRLPYERGEFVTYFVLLSIVSMLTSTWLAQYLAENIRLGTLSLYLIRPGPRLANYMGNNLGEKIVKLPLLLPLVVGAALLFHDDIHLPSQPERWLLFAVSVVLAMIVAFLLDVVIGSLAFWIEDVAGLVRVKSLVGAFLAGQFVPLALFPVWAQPFLEVQPFRYTLSFPLEVLLGTLPSAELGRGFMWQVGYCMVLWLICRVQWRYGLRAYSATGA